MRGRDGSQRLSTTQCTLAAFSPTPHNQERYCDCPNIESTRPASLILFHSALVPGNQHRHAPHDMRGTHPGPSNQSTRRGRNVFGCTWSSTHSLFLAKRVWLPHCTFIARPFTSSGDLLTADGFVLSCPIHLHLLQIERPSVRHDRIRRSRDHVLSSGSVGR